MKTHTGAARMLALPALAALLALLGGARAGAAGGACDPHTTLKITVKIPQKREMGRARLTYGKDVIIHFSAKDIKHLEMKEDSKSLHIVEVNTTTAQLCVKKPNVGRNTYSWVDGETGCEGSVTVVVSPAMSVESSKVHYKPPNDYFVPLGEDFEVFCSGHDSEALELYGNRLVTVINSTSIKFRTKADRVGKTFYTCWVNLTTTHKHGWRAVVITVTVEYYPECHNFSCVLYEYSVIECSWNYSSNIIRSYQLFYTDATEGYLDTTHLCGDPSGNVATGACRVDEASIGRSLFHGEHLSLLLMSCSPYMCKNQSISLNRDVITKQHPVFGFTVLNTSAHGVALTWTYSNYYYHNYNLAHKVEYRQIKLDDDWRVGDLSSLRCDDNDNGDHRCECRLALPYPDAKYEVRVYIRHEAATDDRVWSNPESLNVTTEPLQGCACSEAPDTPAEPTTTISAETVSCEVCTDTEDIIKQSLALKNKLRSMKDKIKRITNLIQVNKLLNNLD